MGRAFIHAGGEAAVQEAGDHAWTELVEPDAAEMIFLFFEDGRFLGYRAGFLYLSSFDQCEIVVGVIGKDGGPAQDWHIVIGALGVQSSQSGESLRHGFHRVAFGVEQWHPFELSVPFSVSTLNRA
jgi:hypothetical protein